MNCLTVRIRRRLLCELYAVFDVPPHNQLRKVINPVVGQIKLNSLTRTNTGDVHLHLGLATQTDSRAVVRHHAICHPALKVAINAGKLGSPV